MGTLTWRPVGALRFSSTFAAASFHGFTSFDGMPGGGWTSARSDGTAVGTGPRRDSRQTAAERPRAMPRTPTARQARREAAVMVPFSARSMPPEVHLSPQDIEGV